MVQGSKHDLLTEQEMLSFSLSRRFKEYLDECAGRLGVSLEQMRVLDWGCGRGRTVLKLLEMGIDAYGVDIDPKPIKNGFSIMKGRGFDPQKRLICIEPDCLTPFADNFFHVILSEQVFEHVSNLDALAAELFRITMPGGAGFHVFPAKWCVVEPHLFLPFAHWLPKNRLRYWYLYLMVNRISAWSGMEGKCVSDRVDTYYNYLAQKTYYRSLKDICTTLRQMGFDVFPQASRRPGRKHKILFPFLLLNNQFSSEFWTWWLNNFNVVELRTVRK